MKRYLWPLLMGVTGAAAVYLLWSAIEHRTAKVAMAREGLKPPMHSAAAPPNSTIYRQWERRAFDS